MQLIGTDVLTQVALVVNDIEKTKARLAKFFGIPEPDTLGSGDFAITKTEVFGKPPLKVCGRCNGISMR